MTTLREYFETDFPGVACQLTTLNLTMANDARYAVPARIHCDFVSGTKFLSFFIPSCPDTYSLCAELVAIPQWVIGTAKTEMRLGFAGENMLSSAELRFSGRIFLYLEDLLPTDQSGKLEQMAKERGVALVTRTPASAQARSQLEKPLAFICHDSRDKADIAGPIAQGLSKMRCPVWYAGYSLNVGSSLRASIEKGLKECKKCVLVLSPNFLSNIGWTKTEFDSVFTRQILEGSDVVLPVWCGVTKQQIYEYSPSLLDRFAALWDEGLEEVVRKLYRAII